MSALNDKMASHEASCEGRVEQAGGVTRLAKTGREAAEAKLAEEREVRFHIIRNACMENVGKSQSCMVSRATCPRP